MLRRKAAVFSVKSISALSQVASPTRFFPFQSVAGIYLGPPGLFFKAFTGSAAENVYFMRPNGNDYDRRRSQSNGMTGDGHGDGRQMGDLNRFVQDNGNRFDRGGFNGSSSVNNYRGHGHNNWSNGGTNSTGPDGYGRGNLRQSQSGGGQGYQNYSHGGGGGVADHGDGNFNGYSSNHHDGYGREMSHGSAYPVNGMQSGYQSYPSRQGGVDSTAYDRPLNSSTAMQNSYSANACSPEINQYTGAQIRSYEPNYLQNPYQAQSPPSGANLQQNPYQAQSPPSGANLQQNLYQAQIPPSGANFQQNLYQAQSPPSGANLQQNPYQAQSPPSGANLQQNPYQAQSPPSGANLQQNPYQAQSPPSGANLQQNLYRTQNQSAGYGVDAFGSLFRNSASQEESASVPDELKFRGTIEELDDLCKQGKVQDALEVLGMLVNQGISIDQTRYHQLMQACGEANALEEAKAVSEHIMRTSSVVEVPTYNKMIDMYAKCGSMDDAIRVFLGMPVRNMTTWDVVINGYTDNRMGEEAIDAFTQFKQLGLIPDDKLFIGVFNACSLLYAVEEGLLHFKSMMKNYNISPTMAHCVAVVELLGKSGYLDEALEFIEKMPLEPTVDVWEALMNLCRVYGNSELGLRCTEMVKLLDPSRSAEKSNDGLLPVKAADIALEKAQKISASLARGVTHEYRAGDTSHPETPRIHENLKFLRAHIKEAGYVADTTCVLHDVDHESKEEAILYHSEKLALSYSLISTSVRSELRIIKNLRICKDCHSALKIISGLAGRLIVCRDAKRFHHFRDGACSCKDYW